MEANSSHSVDNLKYTFHAFFTQTLERFFLLSVFQIKAARLHQNDEQSLLLTVWFTSWKNQANFHLIHQLQLSSSNRITASVRIYCKLWQSGVESWSVSSSDHSLLKKEEDDDKDRNDADFSNISWAFWYQWQSCPHCGTSVAVPHGTSERTNAFITISGGPCRLRGERGALNQQRDGL